MAGNVISSIGAYTNAAAAYEGYKVSADTVKKVKEGDTSGQSSKVDKEAEIRMAESLKKAIAEINESRRNPNVISEGRHGAQMIANWQNQNAKGYLAMSGTEKAETMLRAYTQIYDEIEQGYAQGTRTKYYNDGVDENGEKKYRKATREEEIAELNKAFEGQINRIANQNSEDIIVQYPADQKEAAASMFKNSMLDITSLFSQQYSQKMPGTFDIEGFLKNVTIFK